MASASCRWPPQVALAKPGAPGFRRYARERIRRCLRMDLAKCLCCYSIYAVSEGHDAVLQERRASSGFRSSPRTERGNVMARRNRCDIREGARRFAALSSRRMCLTLLTPSPAATRSPQPHPPCRTIFRPSRVRSPFCRTTFVPAGDRYAPLSSARCFP